MPVQESPEKLEILMQSKNLIETSYNVTGIQNKVFYYCLFTAQKEKSGELCCTIRKKDIEKLIQNPNQKTVTAIKNMFKVFKETALLFDKEDAGDHIECDYNLIAGFEYNRNKQEFKVFFMERLYKHILTYTQYAPLNLEIMTKFNSFYSQRLYEALRMWSRTGEERKHIFSIETLRFLTGVGDKYPEYKNFKQRVLNQALTDINAYGNMEVRMEEIKYGKKVEKIEFIIFDKEPKRYFLDKKEQVEPDLNIPFPQQEIDIYEYVQYPDTNFLSPKIKEEFIKYCYDTGLTFDKTITRLFEESKTVFKYKKGITSINKLSDYKYFLGIFKNKLEDDLNQFASATCGYKNLQEDTEQLELIDLYENII